MTGSALSVYRQVLDVVANLLCVNEVNQGRGFGGGERPGFGLRWRLLGAKREPKGGWRIYLGGVKNTVKNKVFGLVGALWVVKRRLADLCWGCWGSKSDSEPILDRFWTDLGSVWGPFWSIFD